MLKNTYKLYIKENYTSENLLKYALKDYANIDKYEIVYNEYGKPYLKNIDIYFNISNSKNVSVCVISNREVGIDIQYKTYKESLKNKVFNNKEQELLDKSIEKLYKFEELVNKFFETDFNEILELQSRLKEEESKNNTKKQR